MDTKKALKAHMAKGMSEAHPDKNAKKMAKGGVTNEMRLKFGRNMARAVNQKDKK